MTRTQALLKLLEHGPLPRKEIIDIMGGHRQVASNAISRLHARRKIKRLILSEVGEVYALNAL